MMYTFLRLFSTFLFVLLLTACSVIHQPLRHKPCQTCRVMTYNVNWGKSDDWKITKPLATTRAINLADADIVLLQETTPEWEKLTNRHCFAKYPYQQFRHVKDAGGLGVLSKAPFTTRIYIHPHIGWYAGWIINAQSPIGNIQIANLHLTPPLVSDDSVGFLAEGVFTTPPVRLAEIRYYYHLLKPNQTTIVAGDFNENETGSAVRFMQKHFCDVFNVERPTVHTWRWESPLFTLTDRLDRIFYSRDLRQIRLQVLKAGNSDHYPLMVDLIKDKH